MSWIAEKLHGSRVKRADDALVATTDVINQSRSLRQQLEPFREQDDPFAAMVRWSKVSRQITEVELNLKRPKH